MEVTGNVKSGWRKFLVQNSTTTSRAKGGKLQNKEAQHAEKTRIPKSNGKAKILKKEKGNPGIIKIVKKEILQKLKP